MGRLIFLAVVVIAVVWLLRRAVSGPPSAGGKPSEAEGVPKGDLVSCAHCGLNLPKAETRSAGDRHYCSDEHRQMGPRDG